MPARLLWGSTIVLATVCFAEVPDCWAQDCASSQPACSPGPCLPDDCSAHDAWAVCHAAGRCNEKQPPCEHRCGSDDCTSHDAWWLTCKVLGPLRQTALDKARQRRDSAKQDLLTAANGAKNAVDPNQVASTIAGAINDARAKIRDAQWAVCQCGVAGARSFLPTMEALAKEFRGLGTTDVAGSALTWALAQNQDLNGKVQTELNSGSQAIVDAERALEDVIKGLNQDQLTKIGNGDWSGLDQAIQKALDKSKQAMQSLAQTALSQAVPVATDIGTRVRKLIALRCASQWSGAQEAMCVFGPLFLTQATLPALPVASNTTVAALPRLAPTNVAGPPTPGDIIQLGVGAGDVAAAYLELQTRRQLPAPVNTGHDPTTARTDAGRAVLATRASTYETWMRKFHLIDGEVAGCVEVTVPQVGHRENDINQYQALNGCQGDKRISNGGGDLAKYLGALAHKYAVTTAPADLESLRDALWGYYNVMTIAGSSAGNIQRLPNTDSTDAPQQVAPKPGLPVRFYASQFHSGSKLSYYADHDLTTSSPDAGKGVFVYNGPLTMRCHVALPGTTPDTGQDCSIPGPYRFIERQSSDDDYWLFWAALSAYEALDGSVDRDWRQRIATAAARYGVNFLNSGLVIRGMDGRLPNNAGIPMDEVNTSLGSKSTDPYSFLGRIAFLKAAVYLADRELLNEDAVPGIGRVKAVYRRMADAFNLAIDRGTGYRLASLDSPARPTGGLPALSRQDALIVANATAELTAQVSVAWAVVSPDFAAYADIYWLFAPIWNTEHYVPAIAILAKYEKDGATQRRYRWFAQSVIKAVADSARSPLLDFILADVLGTQGEVLAERASGSLYQFRDLPAPLGRRPPPALNIPANDVARYYTPYCFTLDANPTIPLGCAHPTWVSPLWRYVKHFWEEDVRLHARWIWDAAAGNGQSKFQQRPHGIWPLGPGLVPTPESEAYLLVGGSPNDNYVAFGSWQNSSGGTSITLHSQQDYLAAYWLARHKNLLGP